MADSPDVRLGMDPPRPPWASGASWATVIPKRLGPGIRSAVSESGHGIVGQAIEAGVAEKETQLKEDRDHFSGRPKPRPKPDLKPWS